MRNKFIAVTVWCILAALNVLAQEQSPSGSLPFHIGLPQTVDTTNLSIRYYLTGDFGMYSSFIRTKAGVWDYEFDTSYNGQPAKALKVIIYCSGYQVETFDFPSLAAVHERRVLLQLKPLATIPFNGRVLLPAHLSPEAIRVDVSYSAFWECEFLDLVDCLIASLKINSVELTEGGRFKVALPDLAHDQIVGSFRNPGNFTFRAIDRKSGKFLFNLNLKENPEGHGRISIANGYADEQIFIPEVER
jgi:hypothetical protein